MTLQTRKTAKRCCKCLRDFKSPRAYYGDSRPVCRMCMPLHGEGQCDGSQEKTLSNPKRYGKTWQRFYPIREAA